MSGTTTKSEPWPGYSDAEMAVVNYQNTAARATAAAELVRRADGTIVATEAVLDLWAKLVDLDDAHQAVRDAIAPRTVPTEGPQA